MGRDDGRRQQQAGQETRGYVGIPRECYDELLKADLNGPEMRVMLAVGRLTFGWDAKGKSFGDWMSHEQIRRQTGDEEGGLSRRQIARAIGGFKDRRGRPKPRASSGLVARRFLLVTQGRGKVSFVSWGPAVLGVRPDLLARTLAAHDQARRILAGEEQRATSTTPREYLKGQGTGKVVPRSGTRVVPAGGTTSPQSSTAQRNSTIPGSIPSTIPAPSARTRAQGAPRVAQHGKRSLNKQTSPDIAQVIVGYSRLYYERHGVKPTITRGKDGEIVKRMLSACGGDVAEVLGVIETGLDSQDPFLKDKGFSLSALWSNWQGLQLARKEKRTHGDREVRRGSRTHGPTDASKFGRGLVKG